MKKGSGKIRKVCGTLYCDELKEACDKLPDNQEYEFLIVNQERNRTLPYTKYLFSVVLKYIASMLPDHPSAIALYKYFEDMFAPIHTCTINGEQFEYCELKSEKVIDVNNFIERVVEYASEKWGIEIPTQYEMTLPENRDFYSQAYMNQDIAWNSVISSLKKSKDNERRTKQAGRI